MIDYAKVGGPPDNWRGLRVFDLESGDEVRDIYEVSAKEGWLIKAARNSDGDIYLMPGTDDIATERLTGRFEIRDPD